jgi:hypothetical protein
MVYRNPNQRNKNKETAHLTIPSTDTANAVGEKGKITIFFNYCKRAGHVRNAT